MKRFLFFILFSTFFVAVSFVSAGSLTPTSSPSATHYTLTDIYNRLNTNATATLGDHTVSSSGSMGATFRSFTEIYDAIPTIDATKVILGTSYLGVTGTLTPDGGTATTAGLFSGLTAQLTNDWSLDTGTLNLACNTSTFNGIANLVSDSYDGSGDGSNRWCMTNSGNANADDIISGVIAWVDGQAITGTLASQSLSATSETLTAGVYTETTLSLVDTDLVAENIISGVSVFGIDGSAIEATGNATTGQVLAGVTFSNTSSSGLTGTMTNVGVQTITPGTSNVAITTGYHNGSGYCVGDTDLVSGNIVSGITLFGVDGSALESTGTATVGQVLAGATFSNTSSSGLTGTITNVGAQTITPGTTNTTITAGYHNGSGYCAGDSDLTAGNIVTGTTIFGVDGSVIEATGNATAGQVLSGATFSNASSSGLTGTMTNVGAQTITPTTSNTTITAGYHNGSGYCAGDTDLTSGNIKNGTDIFGVTGNYEGTVPNISTCNSLGYSCTGSSGDVCTCGNNGCVNNANGSGVTSYTDICTASGLAGLKIQGKEDGSIRTSLSINLNCLLGCNNTCDAKVCYIP